MHNLGRNESERARKEIEQEFGLIKAEDKKQERVPGRISLDRIIYGKIETKKAIGSLVSEVVNSYKFSSLPEFNAVLQLYGVTAFRGEKGSRMFEKKGLVYSIIDNKNNRVGVPIKASSLSNKPTLVMLEELFERKTKAKQVFKEELRQKLNKQIAKGFESVTAFQSALKPQKIDLILRQNKEGVIYGITYVDHHTKCVFNGSDLGKNFSAKGISEACLQPKQVQPGERTFSQKTIISGDKTVSIDNPTQSIVDPVATYSYLPFGFRKKRKKRGRKL